jgi:putative toxin-antitoxin system antitoxin component (TIGR02293 family)
MQSFNYEDIVSIKSSESIFPVIDSGLKSSESIFPVIDSGFSVDVLTALAKRLDISVNQLVGLLPVSRSTWNRLRTRRFLDAKLSDRVVLFMNLVEDGNRILGPNFVRWLNRPLRYFNMRTPMSLMNTVTGLNMVSAELGRIEYGVFA